MLEKEISEIKREQRKSNMLLNLNGILFKVLVCMSVLSSLFGISIHLQVFMYLICLLSIKVYFDLKHAIKEHLNYLLDTKYNYLSPDQKFEIAKIIGK